MKKILFLLLTVALLMSCFASCSYFGGDATHSADDKKLFFVSPEDEERAVSTVTHTDENGLRLEVTLHGYKSESLGKEFYVKNNEYFLVDVKLTNESDKTFHQFLPTSCRDCSPAHNHEISFNLESGDRKLNSSSFGFTCAEKTDTWTVEPGKSYEWQLKLAAGSQQTDFIFGIPSEEGSSDKYYGDIKDQFAGEKESASDFYVYESNVVQGGNVQIYESTYVNVGGNVFGTVGQNGALGSSFHYVIGGSAVNVMGVLPSDGNPEDRLTLYGNSLFPDNVCTFAGTLSFAYMPSAEGVENSLAVSVPLAIEVVYVSTMTNVTEK